MEYFYLITGNKWNSRPTLYKVDRSEVEFINPYMVKFREEVFENGYWAETHEQAVANFLISKMNKISALCSEMDLINSSSPSAIYNWEHCR